MRSHHIRQRLLEKETLDLDTAFDIAYSLHKAQEHSAAYLEQPSIAVAAPLESINCSSDNENVEMSLAMSKTNRKCYFCGRAYHDRKHCPALYAICHKCGKEGHWAIACQGKRANTINRYKKEIPGTSAALSFSSSLCTITASCPGSLLKSSLPLSINGVRLTALIDTGSSESYINSRISDKLKLSVYPSSHKVKMALSTVEAKCLGFCLVDITLNGVLYKSVILNIFKDLCSDVILGLDFQSKHSRIIVELNGESPELVVSYKPNCALTAALTDKASLFSNLAPNCKPIAAKSRRFNVDDRHFIQTSVDKLLKEGIIQPSSSPWRAQVVVVKDETDRHRKRLCIDYSQTINIYTELDAFPLARIDDMVNELSKYSVFSTFDLRSAYHQIEILESERKYTAFEANGKLLEFTRIPFGVKNGVAAFQREMVNFIEKEKLLDTFPYLDNVTVAGRSQKEHDINVKSFLEAIRRRNYTLNDSKSVVSVPEIHILGYVVGKGIIKPDPDRMAPLKEFPPPTNSKQLRRALGMFAYYAKWINCFADKVRPLADTTSFPIKGKSLDAFNNLKLELENAALNSIDENIPFIVECDASDIAVSATLNQGGRPVAFMSRTLQGSELHYPAIEKEATAVIEAIRKWSHLLSRQTFTLITDQRSVAFMLDSRKRTKIKNNKIQQWRMELASFSYEIKYRPGERNIAPDTFTRAFTATCFSSSLDEIHKNLCHPGVTRMLHFVRSKNLPFSTTEVKRAISTCKICAEIKPHFHRTKYTPLIKATQPMERLSIDFKTVPSVRSNKYLLVVVDEYSRFPFAFPCKDMTSSTVIQCLDRIFALCGTTQYIHSDNGPAFISQEFKAYLIRRNIASSKSSIYNPAGNGQVEKYVGIIWKTVQLALKTHNLPLSKWEVVLDDVLHCIRSLLCTATDTTPHERFFSFQRRSCIGKSLPSWLSAPGKAYVRRFVRTSKADPLTDEIEVINVNPTYAHIRYQNGREATVSLRDLAPCPQEPLDNSTTEGSQKINSEVPINEPNTTVSPDYADIDLPLSKAPINEPNSIVSPDNAYIDLPSSLSNPAVTPSNKHDNSNFETAPRRSNRINLGVPPLRYGDINNI